MYPTPRSHRPLIMGRNGAVGANHPMAAQAGLDMLRAGGNAVDASVAISLALGVCEPRMSGLGGDGFYQLFMAKSGRARCSTGQAPRRKPRRPSAMAAASRSRAASSVSVPGSLAGVVAMHAAHGRLPWAGLVAARHRACA